jgi:hypothetical protein
VRAVLRNRSTLARSAASILTPDYVGVHPGHRSIDLGSYPGCSARSRGKANGPISLALPKALCRTSSSRCCIIITTTSSIPFDQWATGELLPV